MSEANHQQQTSSRFSYDCMCPPPGRLIFCIDKQAPSNAYCCNELRIHIPYESRCGLPFGCTQLAVSQDQAIDVARCPTQRRNDEEEPCQPYERLSQTSATHGEVPLVRSDPLQPTLLTQPGPNISTTSSGKELVSPALPQADGQCKSAAMLLSMKSPALPDIDENLSDGRIYLAIRRCQSTFDTLNEERWWKRFSPSKQKYLRRLLKHGPLTRAFDTLSAILGLWDGLLVGSLHKLLTLHCEEVGDATD